MSADFKILDCSILFVWINRFCWTIFPTLLSGLILLLDLTSNCINMAQCQCSHFYIHFFLAQHHPNHLLQMEKNLEMAEKNFSNH